MLKTLIFFVSDEIKQLEEKMTCGENSLEEINHLLLKVELMKQILSLLKENCTSSFLEEIEGDLNKTAS